MSDWTKLRETENLQRAWRWIRASADASYKSYFRDLYRNYSASEDALIADLSDRLRRGVYSPTPASKIFFPKASGILRPYSLLTVEDQIVYQAAINLVADKLYPRVGKRYNKEVFGHLYAGKSSTWFYRKWSDGYKAFNAAATKAFSDGLTFTASFDLTAYYDSLDHGVLRHFLVKLGFDIDFCKQLTNWLEVWTATEREIYHNHGIPQGPLPSGLLSEVVLGHFDSLTTKGLKVRYLRYVDDIRLFARNERELRRVLVGLDLLSKDVGLFPQSGKIQIHEITDIREELKTISDPPEASIQFPQPNQAKLSKRILELSPRFFVADQTRFKYLVAHAVPSAALTARLWRVLENHPNFYKSICAYLRRYTKLPRAAAQKAVAVIKTNSLYHSIQADFVNAIDGRLPPTENRILASYLRKIWLPRSLHPDLLARSARFLIRAGKLTPGQIIYVSGRARSWWARATMTDQLAPVHIGTHTWQTIVDERMKDECSDVALAAAWESFTSGYRPAGRPKTWNPSAAIMLRELGVIQRKTASYCGINKSIQKLDRRIPTCNWKRFFGKGYDQAERQAVEIGALSGTNITAFVNAFDVYNDLLLDALFRNDGTIGGYVLGKIGSALNPASRLASKYPHTLAFVKAVHDARYQSMYSHPLIGRSSRPTKKISYKILSKIRPLLRAATSELIAASLI